MAVVETQIDSSASLTLHTAHGVITTKDILNIVDNYYKGTVTKLILWNFVESELNQISIEDVRVLASLTKKYCKSRPGGKTALVFARLVDYGIGRMFQILSEMSDDNVEFMPFSDFTTVHFFLLNGDMELNRDRELFVFTTLHFFSSQW